MRPQYHRHTNGDVVPNGAERCIDPKAGAEDVIVLTPAEFTEYVAAVRADEQHRIRLAIEAEVHHAADNGHILDRDCQGVAPGEKVPAVRSAYVVAAVSKDGAPAIEEKASE